MKNTPTVRQTAAALAFLATWLFLHPYHGIIHDAQLYLLQALHLLEPDRFNKDLFFLGGTQDSFTLFSNLHALVIRTLGVESANITLYFVGHGIWVTGTIILFHRLTGGGWAWWIALLLVAAPGGYSTRNGLHYAEFFLVPRTWAEALCILAMLGWFSNLPKWKRWGWLANLSSLIVNPIMGLTGLAFGILWRWGAHPLKLTALLLGGVVLVAIPGFMGIPPFDRLTSIMDPEWYQTVCASNPSMRILMLNWYDINRLLLDAAILSHAAIIVHERRKLILTIGFLALAGILTSLIFADWLHVQLIVQLQTWRVLWLTRYLMLPLLAVMVVRLSAQGLGGKTMLLWYAIAWIEIEGTWGILWDSWSTFQLFGGTIAVSAALYAAFRHFQPTIAGSQLINTHLPAIATLCLLGLQSITFTFRLETWIHQFLHPINEYTFDLRRLVHWLTPTMLQPTLLAGGLLLARMRKRWLDAAGLGMVLGLTGLALLMIDFRADFLRDFERYSYRSATRMPTFEATIPRHATVYWEEMVWPVWFWLGRSNYMSMAQFPPLVFSREKTGLYLQRVRRLANLGVSDGRIAPWWLPAHRLHPPTRDGLIHLCHDPDLDFAVLLDRLLPGEMITAHEMVMGHDWKLYDCRRIRQAYPDPGEETSQPVHILDTTLPITRN